MKSKEQYKSREAFDERVAKQLKSLAKENQKLKQEIKKQKEKYDDLISRCRVSTKED